MLLQECNQRRVDLGSALLLNPMTGAIDDELLLEVRQNPLHVAHTLGADQTGDNRVVRPGDEL
jgi:hypothetical protein